MWKSTPFQLIYNINSFCNLAVSQELICLRAVQDVNVPKFLQDDLKLFSGIVSDLFPDTKQEPIDYGILEESMRNVCIKKNLKDVDGWCFYCFFTDMNFAVCIKSVDDSIVMFAGFINKCIQLYETTVVRHGLMLVGPSGSGKTKVSFFTHCFCVYSFKHKVNIFLAV